MSLEPETLETPKVIWYLKNNEAYLVNYEEREQQNKPYTSQVAETHWFDY